jgi:hypothetical protein
MKAFVYFLFKCFLFLFLTVLTQIGGLVYLLSIYLAYKWNKQFRFKKLFVFSCLYFLSTFFITPFVAPIFGREQIESNEGVKAASFFTTLCNRNYVAPKWNAVLESASNDLIKKGIVIKYLDANFPFFNGFPLLPHLSHNDGKKLDLSFVYVDESGGYSGKVKSLTGYGVFEEPWVYEHNRTELCKKQGYWQYDFTKHLGLFELNKELKFSAKGSRSLILKFINSKEVNKVFIEPHLKSRLRLNYSIVRFHGCGAVRHDDHIHLELK